MPLNDHSDNQTLIEFILNKNWEELETAEHAGYLLFPDEILKRKKDGTFERVPVMIRVPREHETRKARIEARTWAKDDGLDPELDPDLFDNMDTLCILAQAIRNTSPPHEPFEPDPKRLEKVYDRPSLDAIWAKLQGYREVLDPRPNSLTDEQTMAIIGAVAKARNTVPLAALGGRSQTNLIVTMANRLTSSRPSK